MSKKERLILEAAALADKIVAASVSVANNIHKKGYDKKAVSLLRKCGQKLIVEADKLDKEIDKVSKKKSVKKKASKKKVVKKKLKRK